MIGPFTLTTVEPFPARPAIDAWGGIEHPSVTRPRGGRAHRQQGHARGSTASSAATIDSRQKSLHRTEGKG